MDSNIKTVLVITALFGAPLTVSGQMKSPDGRYSFEYFKALPHEANVKFKSVNPEKVLMHGFSYGYEPQGFLETAWSPDSQYLAVVSRGTKTTADIEIYKFRRNSVEQVEMPDYRLNLLGRKHLVEGGRHHWVNNLVWTDSKITFRCRGQWVDGSGDPESDPDNWYRFAVTIDLSSSRARLSTVLKAEAQDKAEKSGAKQPAIRSDSQ